MSLKIYVPKTEISQRPILDQRITFRLYKTLLTDLLDDCHLLNVSLNERVLNILEMYYSERVSKALSYPNDIRPLWKKKQAERCRTNTGRC